MCIHPLNHVIYTPRLTFYICSAYLVLQLMAQKMLRTNQEQRAASCVQPNVLVKTPFDVLTLADTEILHKYLVL